MSRADIDVATTCTDIMRDVQRVAYHLYAVLRQMPTEANFVAVQLVMELLREVTHNAKRYQPVPRVPMLQVDAHGTIINHSLGA